MKRQRFIINTVYFDAIEIASLGDAMNRVSTGKNWMIVVKK